MITDAQQDLVFDLMERAWEADKPADGAKWARKALAINPDELDAYVLLAKATTTTAEKIALLSEGARRGKKIWAAEIKRPAQSHFWLDMDTRPFLRNVHWLALLQWEADERGEAILNAEFLLRLNPNDNQGIRYLLLNWLPVLGKWEGHSRLLKKYKSDSGTDYLYARCLNLFCGGQDSNAALAEAIEANPHVSAYLAETKRQPPDDDNPLPGYVSPGSESEAHAYAEAAREAWLSVPGALDWLTSAAS
jgi:hypothetical protein